MTRYERYKKGMDILGRAIDYVECLDIENPEELTVAKSVALLFAAMRDFHHSVNQDTEPDIGFWSKDVF